LILKFQFKNFFSKINFPLPNPKICSSFNQDSAAFSQSLFKALVSSENDTNSILSYCASFCNVWKRKTRAPAHKDYLVSCARVTITITCAAECNFAEYKNQMQNCEEHPVFLTTEKRIINFLKTQYELKKKETTLQDQNEAFFQPFCPR